MVKLSGVYLALGSLTRLYSCVDGDGKSAGVLRADLAAPARISDNIYKISISFFVCHFRHRSLPQSSSSFVAVSRNRNIRNGITDHGDSHARTSVYIRSRTRGILTQTDTLPITTDTRISGPISLRLAIMRISHYCAPYRRTLHVSSPPLHRLFPFQSFRFSFFLSLSFSLSFTHILTLSLYNFFLSFSLSRSHSLFFYLAQSASQPSRKLQVV